MIKADGTFMVWADGGGPSVKPLNYLEMASADLGVLLASIPPTGGSSFAKRLIHRYPGSFFKTIFTARGSHSPQMTREMFFTPETPEDIVGDCHSRLGRESMRILMDMSKPNRTELIKTPVIAIGADADEIVAPREEVLATAKTYGTKPIHLPGGHCMMLDTEWEQAASAIETAIAEHVPWLAAAASREAFAAGRIWGARSCR
jgi:hypothetical protein